MVVIKQPRTFMHTLDLYGKSQLGTRLGSALGKSELVG